jgi:hypothetical protein
VVPSRADVLTVLDAVLTGTLTREAASQWAASHHIEVMDDASLEEALDVLVLIDARHTSDDGVPLNYLYDLSEIATSRAALL